MISRGSRKQQASRENGAKRGRKARAEPTAEPGGGVADNELPVFGKSTRELSGHTEEILGFVWFHFRKQRRENHRHLNPSCRPFFSVCIREVSSKKPKDFFGVYRYFAGADSEYWHGALKKSFLVGVWRVYFSHHSQNPAPWFAADG